MEAVEGRDGFSAAMQELWKTGHGSEKAGGEELPGTYQKRRNIDEKSKISCFFRRAMVLFQLVIYILFLVP